jgi:hypothetical protein
MWFVQFVRNQFRVQSQVERDECDYGKYNHEAFEIDDTDWQYLVSCVQAKEPFPQELWRDLKKCLHSLPETDDDCYRYSHRSPPRGRLTITQRDIMQRSINTVCENFIKKRRSKCLYPKIVLDDMELLSGCRILEPDEKQFFPVQTCLMISPSIEYVAFPLSNGRERAKSKSCIVTSWISGFV